MSNVGDKNVSITVDFGTKGRLVENIIIKFKYPPESFELWGTNMQGHVEMITEIKNYDE